MAKESRTKWSAREKGVNKVNRMLRCLVLYVNFTGHRVPRLNIISGYDCESVSE